MRGGYYGHDWNPDDTLENGYHWIKAEYEGDEDHIECSQTTGVEAIPNIFVIPESITGTIGTTLAAFASPGILTLHKRRHARP